MADSLDSVLKLLQAFSGKSGTETSSGGTTTKQTILSQDVLNAMLQSALEQNGGLADVVSGQRQAGLYNSTVNTQLTNDLVSRLATQTAVAGAPTVTTTPKTTVKQATQGLGASGAGTLAALSLGKNTLDQVLGTKGKKSLLDMVTGGSETPSTVNTGSISALGDAPMMSAGGESVQNVSASDLTDYWSATEAIGDFVPDAASSGMEAFEAVGAMEEPIAGLGTDTGDSWFKGCFITTAVCESQGKPDDCYELETLRKFRDTWLKENHPEDIEEYYKEAPKLVKALAKLPEVDYLYQRMYQSYIVPAIILIENERFDSAYSTYRGLYDFCVQVTSNRKE